jgi:hypothetical protein
VHLAASRAARGGGEAISVVSAKQPRARLHGMHRNGATGAHSGLHELHECGAPNACAVIAPSAAQPPVNSLWVPDL